jgi:cytidine deaminase
MLTPDRKQGLIDAADQARQRAYAPYSDYPVGAALLTSEGQVFVGANLENSAFPLTICAERAAVASAVSNGQQSFEAIAVITRDAGSPCGSCRQVLAEFGLDTLVIIADDRGAVQHELTVAELLPNSFGPINLKNSGA